MGVPFPNSTDLIEGGRVVLDASAPSATNLGTDTLVPFAQPVEHLLIQNNTAAAVWINFDAAAAVGALVLLAAGTMLVITVPCKTLHVFTAAAQQINSTATGISIAGWT